MAKQQKPQVVRMIATQRASNDLAGMGKPFRPATQTVAQAKIQRSAAPSTPPPAPPKK